MRASSPDRSLGTLFTGVPHSAGAVVGDTISIFARNDEFGHLSLIILDARGVAVGTLTPAECVRQPTLRYVGEPLRSIIWAWRQGLRMAGLDLEISAYNGASHRLEDVEEYLRVEASSPSDRFIDETMIGSLRSVNLKLVKITR